MGIDAYFDVAQRALALLVWIVAPPVGASLLAGLAVSVVQAATQVQEQTASFAVRAAATFAALVVAGPWIARELGLFTASVLELVGQVAR